MAKSIKLCVHSQRTVLPRCLFCCQGPQSFSFHFSQLDFSQGGWPTRHRLSLVISDNFRVRYARRCRWLSVWIGFAFRSNLLRLLHVCLPCPLVTNIVVVAVEIVHHQFDRVWIVAGDEAIFIIFHRPEVDDPRLGCLRSCVSDQRGSLEEQELDPNHPPSKALYMQSQSTRTGYRRYFDVQAA